MHVSKLFFVGPNFCGWPCSLQNFCGLNFTDACNHAYCTVQLYTFCGSNFLADSHLIIHENCENWTLRKFPVVRYCAICDHAKWYIDGELYDLNIQAHVAGAIAADPATYLSDQDQW